LRIGVLSDTHGDFSSLEKAIDKLKDVDLILHAGDFYKDAEYVKAVTCKKVIGVLGNCDVNFGLDGDYEKVLEIEGKRFFLTHGHYFYIKSDLGLLIKRAKELCADVVVFGHTHKALNIEIDNIIFFNPGSTTLPRGENLPSCGMIEVNKEEILAKVIEI